MAMDNKPTTTVDPNTSPSKDLENHSQEEYGAKTPIDHPLTHSTVNPNYEPSTDAPGFPSGDREKRKSEPESDETAGVSGAGGKFTDDNDAD